MFSVSVEAELDLQDLGHHKAQVTGSYEHHSPESVRLDSCLVFINDKDGKSLAVIEAKPILSRQAKAYLNELLVESMADDRFQREYNLHQSKIGSY